MIVEVHVWMKKIVFGLLHGREFCRGNIGSERRMGPVVAIDRSGFEVAAPCESKRYKSSQENNVL